MSVNKLSDSGNLAFLVSCWQSAEVKPTSVNWSKICADYELKNDAAKERLTRLLAKYEDGKLKATSTVENPAGPNTPPASPGPEKKEKKAPAKRGKAKATVAKKTATRKTTGAGNGRGKKRKIEQVEVEEENDEGGCENKENGGEART